MNDFLFYEEEGRDEFAHFLGMVKNATNWNPVPISDSVDGYFDLDGKKIVVEIKTRDSKYLYYPSHIIELFKLKSLIRAKEDHNCHAGIYVNLFGDLKKGIYDTMYIYNINIINNHNCALQGCMTAKTTVVDRGNECKQLFYIPIEYAKKFKKINNTWTQIN